MPRTPKEFIAGLRVTHTKARAAVDEIMMSGEFKTALLIEIRKDCPPFLSHLVTNAAFNMIRLKEGWSLLLYNKIDPGKILAIWNFGIPHDYRIPKVGNVTMYMGEKIGFKEHAIHKAKAPNRFISRAWHRTINRYTMRIKREIEYAIRGKF